MNEAEATLLGVSHAEVGAFLLGLWGLPYPVVEAVAYHHQPRRAGEMRMDVLAAVHIANALAWHAVSPETGGKLDDELIATLGVASRLDAWKQMAQEHVSQRKESA
jgi:HD-like signal output (HDOD) protein